MSEEAQRVRLNGFKWPVVFGLMALFGQLAVLVWGASALNARVGSIEVEHVRIGAEISILADSVHAQGISTAVMGAKIDNINENVKRLLDQWAGQ